MSPITIAAATVLLLPQLIPADIPVPDDVEALYQTVADVVAAVVFVLLTAGVITIVLFMKDGPRRWPDDERCKAPRLPAEKRGRDTSGPPSTEPTWLLPIHPTPGVFEQPPRPPRA